jgi:hypothetical protein
MSRIGTEQAASSRLGKLWRRRLKLVYMQARRLLPFALGVLATFVALLLYHALVPGTPQLTTREVNDSIAQALASATPPPAFSARVYRVI